MTFQEFISIVIRITFLLLRVTCIDQRFGQVTQLGICQCSYLATLGRDTVLQGRSQQCRTEIFLRVAVSHMTNFMADHTQQFFVTHNIHQRRKYPHTTVGTGKSVHIRHIIYRKVQRNSIGVSQTFCQLLQPDGIWIVVRTHLIMFIHPGYVLFHILGHLFIGQRNCLGHFGCTADGFLQIKLGHRRNGQD